MQDFADRIDWDRLPSFSLAGQAAIVTGGAGGIGRSIAAALGHYGASVVVFDLPSTPTAEVVAELRDHGIQAVEETGDVTSTNDATRVVQAALDSFGRLDVLVNNAGLRSNAPALEMTPEAFERVMRVNILGTFVPDV